MTLTPVSRMFDIIASGISRMSTTMCFFKSIPFEKNKISCNYFKIFFICILSLKKHNCSAVEQKVEKIIEKGKPEATKNYIALTYRTKKRGKKLQSYI